MHRSLPGPCYQPLFVISCLTFVGVKVHNDEPCNTEGEHEIELLFPFMKDIRAEGMFSFITLNLNTD